MSSPPKPKKRSLIRSASWDIETTGLDASYNRLLCACVKFDDESRVRTVRCQKLSQETDALKQLRSWLLESDHWITWNGLRFDVPFVNARLMIKRMEPLPPHFHTDLIWQSRKLRTRGNRLEGAAKDLGLQKGGLVKDAVCAAEFVESAQGTGKPAKEAFEHIVHHCYMDVLLTEEMYVRYKPLIRRISKL